MPTGVPMYDPVEDRVVNVHPEDVENAQDEGLTIESADTRARREYQKTAGLGEMLKAAAEGTAGGATLGLSDVALAELGGDDYRRSRRLRSETFSDIETAGQVLGAVAPVLLPGGALATGARSGGLLSRAAAYTPTALAARAAAGAEGLVSRGVARLAVRGAEKGIAREALEMAARIGAGGAVEGGLAGAGFALSEASLADQLGGFDKAAEIAWAGAKEGSMLGLFGGAAMGGLVGSAKGAGSRLIRRWSRNGDELAEAANERAVKTLGVGGGLRTQEIRKLGTEGKVQQIGNDLRNYTLKDGRRVIEALDNADDVAPKVAQARREVGAELGQLRDQVSKAGGDLTEVARSYLRRVDEEVIRPLRSSPSPTVASRANDVEKELQWLRERVAERPALQVRVRNPDGTVSTRTRPQAPPPLSFDELRDVQKALKNVIYPEQPKGQQMRGLVVAPAHANDLVSAERILEESLEGHVSSTLKRTAPDAAGRYSELRRLNESFIKADQMAKKAQGLNMGNRSLSASDYWTGMTLAAGQVAAGDITAPLQGLGLSWLHKQVRERGNSLLVTLANRAEKRDRRVDRALAKYFHRATLPREALAGTVVGEVAGFEVAKALHAAKDEDIEDAYDRVANRVVAAARGELAGPYAIDDEAPNVGHAMRQTQQRVAEHLSRHLPAPPKSTLNPNLAALSAQPKPDPVQLYEFSRRLKAAEDPDSILDDLTDGSISMAAVETVRECYPRIYADHQARVIDKLGQEKELLPYDVRIRAGILFDLPTDETLRPEFLALNQSVYAEQNTPVKPRSPSGGSGFLAQRRASAVEQLEAGEVPT